MRMAEHRYGITKEEVDRVLGIHESEEWQQRFQDYLRTRKGLYGTA
jgi:hypothetical protein